MAEMPRFIAGGDASFTDDSIRYRHDIVAVDA